ncbi:MAG TPA: four helix bundle protein [Candidatus Eisenbacteria bacterium]|nr:four helix bundle protein [Candidatus Eisenbacteria bacterium]
MSSSFRDLRVWQQAVDLALEIYQGTAAFPKHEVYALHSKCDEPLWQSRATLPRVRAGVPIKTFGVFCFRREVPS